MWQPPTINKLPGDRTHLHHGPIDVVLKAWGTPEAVRAATRAATRAFPQILPTLAEEIKELRKPMSKGPKVKGSIAKRMVEACEPFSGVYITPMAAVAGSVAEALGRRLGTPRRQRRPSCSGPAACVSSVAT